MKTKAKLYSVEWFLSFFRKIPASQWCINTRDNHQGQHCVLGHTDKIEDTSSWESEIGATVALGNLLSENSHAGKNFIACVNNGQGGTGSSYGGHANLLQYFKYKSPKFRVLAALRDLRDGKLTNV